MGKLLQAEIERVVGQALAEDLGSGDLTSRLTLPARLKGSARFVARQPLVVSGLLCAQRVFELVNDEVVWEPLVADGDVLARGQELARVHGRMRDLLAGERVALNLLQHLSGVASLASKYVQAAAGTGAKIFDTRKTIPGLRALQKAAVVHGGAANHRMGLYDAVLIKDNHIDACGGIGAAVAAARRRLKRGAMIEVEVRSLGELEPALAAGADIILLDNMSRLAMRIAVRRIRRAAPAVLIEASGRVNLRNVRSIAKTGVDRISVGSLTHSATAVDIAMKFIK